MATIFLPNRSEAYQASAGKAVWLDEDTVVFTIPYRFLYQGYGLMMPIAAKENAVFGTAFPSVGYALFDAAGQPVIPNEISGVVLSSASVERGNYVLPENVAGHFTLLVLATVPSSVVDGAKITLKATTQPYTLLKNGEVITSMLDERQLGTYQVTTAR